MANHPSEPNEPNEPNEPAGTAVRGSERPEESAARRARPELGKAGSS